MRILAVSDEEAKGLYDHYRPGKLDGYDLILSCGDLKKEYLEFLVTMSNVPLLYVHGNHDDSFEKRPPEDIRGKAEPEEFRPPGPESSSAL